MDKLDALLLEAWNRISAKVRANRVSALKRSRRRFKGVLTRPMREWCLVIRASDTRINDYRAIVEPALPLPLGEGWGEGGNERARHGAHALTPNPSPDGRGGCAADFSRNPIENHQPHTVTLDGRLIRELTKPVKIPWPGVTYEQAAAMLGREYKTIKNWVKQGVFRVDHYREHKFPEHTRRSKPRAGLGEVGRGGRPYVWTPSPIDPNNFEGRTPHAVWGTLWQWLWECLPEEYTLTVRREPEFRPYRGAMRFRGWSFICPGRLALAHPSTTAHTSERVSTHPLSPSLPGRGEFVHLPCGRRCRYLYGPQTVWTMAHALSAGEDDDSCGFDMPEDSGLVGRWFPGESDPTRSGGPRSFACKKCWGVHSGTMSNYTGWNEFVTQISGGLLYGRDVPRPMGICPIERKKPPFRARRRKRETSEAIAAAPVIEIAAHG